MTSAIWSRWNVSGGIECCTDLAEDVLGAESVLRGGGADLETYMAQLAIEVVLARGVGGERPLRLKRVIGETGGVSWLGPGWYRGGASMC
jgi:hypothetical protein